MNSNKKSNPKTLTFDEIKKEIENLRYELNPNQKGKSLGSKDTRESNVVNPIRKKDIDKFVEIFSHIEQLPVTEKNAGESKINDIYNLVKTKVGDSIYQFNLKIAIKTLQEFKKIKPEKLSSAIEELLNVILKNIEEELRSLLSQKDYDLLSNLCDDKTKSNLLQIIDSGIIKNKENDEINKIFLSNLYTYIIIRYKNRKDFLSQLSLIENGFIEYLADYKLEKNKKHLLKLLPEALLEKDTKTKIISFAHIYMANFISDLEPKLESVTKRLEASHNEYNKLNKKANELTNEVSQKKEQINELTKREEESGRKIDELEKELTETKKLLEFEVNKSKRQLDGLKSGIIKGLKKQMEMELDDLRDFANDLPKENKNDLKMYIENIEQILKI